MSNPEQSHSEVPRAEVGAEDKKLQTAVETGLREFGMKDSDVDVAINDTREQLIKIAGGLNNLDEPARQEVTNSVITAFKPLAEALAKGEADRSTANKETIMGLNKILGKQDLIGVQTPEGSSENIGKLLRGAANPDDIEEALAILQAGSIAETNRISGNTAISAANHALAGVESAA